jgi:hypothetical protein
MESVKTKAYRTAIILSDAPQLAQSRTLEKERIANFRQRKLNVPPKKEIDVEDQELTFLKMICFRTTEVKGARNAT